LTNHVASRGVRSLSGRGQGPPIRMAPRLLRQKSTFPFAAVVRYPAIRPAPAPAAAPKPALRRGTQYGTAAAPGRRRSRCSTPSSTVTSPARQAEGEGMISDIDFNWPTPNPKFYLKAIWPRMPDHPPRKTGGSFNNFLVR